MTESYIEIPQDELSSIKESYYPKLLEVSSIYLPEIDISKGIPMNVEYLDFIRGSWLNDKSVERVSFDTVVKGLGFALGLVLQNLESFTWSLGSDENENFITMVKDVANGEKISVPPFSYVSKREEVQNVEVFSDLFKYLASEVTDA